MLSASAQEHIGKCQATAMEYVNDMVAHLVCEAALAAAYELWQESLVPVLLDGCLCCFHKTIEVDFERVLFLY